DHVTFDAFLLLSRWERLEGAALQEEFGEARPRPGRAGLKYRLICTSFLPASWAPEKPHWAGCSRANSPTIFTTWIKKSNGGRAPASLRCSKNMEKNNFERGNLNVSSCSNRKTR